MKKKVIYQIFTRLYCNSRKQQLHAGSIAENGCGKMESFTPEILAGIRENGYTDIWFTGLIAHASVTDYSEYGIPVSHASTVKGIAGSPYAIRDYYDIDPDLAVSVPDRMEEFKSLVMRVHDAGLGFIMDFVPNHVAREYKSISMPKGEIGLGEADDNTKAFSPSNNFYYIPGYTLGGDIDWKDYVEYPAKATGNDKFNACPSVCDWYETIKLNYGVDYQMNGAGKQFDPIPSTWTRMLNILLYWASMGVDAFRCDMAEMVPVEFWHWAIANVKKKYKKIQFIAEVYNPGSYSSYINWGGFDYLYDKVGLYDTLRAVVEGRESAMAITACWQRTGDNGPHMLHFMENHDEQRIASDFFAGNAEKGRPAMIVSALMDTCPVMVYAGQELGERGMDQEGFSGRDGRTTIFDYWAPDTLSRLYDNGKFNGKKLSSSEKSLKEFYNKLLNISKKEHCISSGGFFDLMYVNPLSDKFNPHKQYAFLRADSKNAVLVIANFSECDLQTETIIPQHAFDYLSITEGNGRTMTELLTGRKIKADLQPDRPIRCLVPAFSGIVLKFKISQ